MTPEQAEVVINLLRMIREILFWGIVALLFTTGQIMWAAWSIRNRLDE